MSSKSYNLYFIRPVINFVTFLSITPKCDFANAELKHLVVTKAIAAVFSAITAFFAFFFAFQRLTHDISHYKSAPIAYITEFRTFLITMSNVNAMMAIPFRNSRKFKKLIALSGKLSVLSGAAKEEHAKVYGLIFVYNSYIIAYTVCDLINSVQRSTFKDVQNFIFMYVQFYYFYMSSLLLFAFLFFVYKSLKAYNHQLKEAILNVYKVDGGVFGALYRLTEYRARPQLKDYYVDDLHRTCEIFHVWCDVIRLFNQIFGWQIFITLMVIIFDLLLTLNMLIETTGAHLALLLVWTVTLILLGMTLSHCCEKVKQELQTTFSICYGGIYGERGDIRNTVRRELYLLAGQIAYRKPSISAAGFLLIDHNMLFTLLNMLISYIIVLQQIQRRD